MVHLDGAGEIWSLCAKCTHIPSLKKHQQAWPPLVNKVHTGSVGLSVCVCVSI